MPLTRLTRFLPSFREVLEDPVDRWPQAEPDPTDWEILLAQGVGDGVVSGCEVTASSPPAMTVDVAAGFIVVDGTLVEVPAQPDVDVAAANLTQRRSDLVVIDDDGVAGAVVGALEDESPELSVIPIHTVATAALYIPPGLSAILDGISGHIVDKRAPVRAPASFDTGPRLSAHDNDPRTNSAVLAPDAELVVTLAPSSKYTIHATVVFYAPAGGGGAKIGFTAPGTPDHLAIHIRIPNNATGLESGSSAFRTSNETAGRSVFNASATLQRGIAYLDGVIHTDASGGDFTITHAQVVADADATVRLAGSFIERELM